VRLRTALFLLLLLTACLIPSVEAQEQRFPRPEFESDYQKPQTTTPEPRAAWLEVVDVSIITAAMGLVAYFALRRRSRRGIFWVTVGSVVYLGFIREGCVCPVGSVQNVSAALTNPGFLLPTSVVLLFILPLVAALFFGRVFCGGVCPLGALQDLVMLRPQPIAPWLADALGLLRYVYLGLAVLFAATGSMFVVCKYDPFVGFFRLTASSGIMIYSVAFLVLSVFIGRPYCRFLCPYGVLLGWMSRLATWTVRTTPDVCIECRLCENGCPVGAIRTPTRKALPEDRQVALRRLAILLLLLPVVTVAAGWAVSRLDVVLSRVHSTVRLAERIQAEDAGLVTETTLESRTFRASGTPVQELYDQALEIRRQHRVGGWLLGGFLGLIFMLKLIGLSVWRSRSEYEPDAAGCLSCGRCLDFCPHDESRTPGAATTPTTGVLHELK
jgi:ferredoxin